MKKQAPQGGQKRLYDPPRIRSSAPFERLALSCMETNVLGDPAPKGGDPELSCENPQSGS